MRREEPAEVEFATGKVKSGSVNEYSDPLEEASTSLCLEDGPEVELDFDAVCKIAFSSENWFDMQCIILRHTKSDLALVK